MFDNKERYSGKVSEKDLEELFGEASKHGAVLALMYFDAHGPSKEGVENSLVDFVGKISKEKGVLYCKGEVLRALERQAEEGLSDNMRYSCSTEIKILANSFNTLLGLCLRFGPLGVEILKPSELNLNLEEAQSLLLDASQSTQDYVSYIMDKTMTREEKAGLQEHLKRRADVAKQLREDGKMK
ncbi:hypothetical protein HZC09_01075 [Candidatus Micrarchaeota archaeon]|nr:hypothetical protein [Candidatus Micrarchaeota archaeon]